MDTKPESSEVWKMARTFGAKCSAELVEGVTHVVAAKVTLSLVLIMLVTLNTPIAWYGQGEPRFKTAGSQSRVGTMAH